MTKIKLCGMKSALDIEYANELSPDYVGFIFFEKSKRYVSPEKAAELVRRLEENITPVGVFVDSEIPFIVNMLDSGAIRAVQLHGSEDEEYIKELREYTDATIIKAFKIKSADDIERAKESSADYILLDSGQGSGKTFEHELIRDIDRPFFLAGGLYPENVVRAIEKYRPYCVDVSSSLETLGFKDKMKMTAFVKAVRKELS